jgi:penicillin-binding protein 1C
VESSDRLCPIQRTAWLLDGTAPPTFPDNLQSGSPIYTYYVDQVTGLRVSPECAPHALRTVETAHWPAMLEPWLDPGLRRQVLPPSWSVGCGDNYHSGEPIAIAGLNDGAVLHPAQGATMPRARLEIRGSREPVDWMVNGRLVAHETATILNFPDPGSYDITAFDSHGHYDRIRVSVRNDR